MIRSILAVPTASENHWRRRYRRHHYRGGRRWNYGRSRYRYRDYDDYYDDCSYYDDYC